MKNKKIIIGTLSILAFTTLVTGCGKEIEVKNGSKVAVSTKQEKYTATDYYNKIKQDGFSIIPLSLYFSGNFVKLELGIGKGKKLYDKRADIAKKDAEKKMKLAEKN